MHVRSFRLSDYVAVTHVLENVLSAECCEETMEAFARQLSWDSDLVLVADSDEGILGVIIGTIDDNNGYYYRIAVSRDHQRQGIGKALIAAMRKRFLQRKVSRIFVTVDTHNEPILPVYESAGYSGMDFARSFRGLSIVNG